MSYDNTCKYLAETYPEQFAAWLLGRPLVLSVLEPAELQAEPIRADSLISLQASDTVLHLEFQTRPDPNMELRMLDYWLLLRKKYPDRTIHQVVIYLRPTQSELAQQMMFRVGCTQHKFQAIDPWEPKPDNLSPYLGLLPLRTLCQSTDLIATLRTVQAEISQIPDRATQANLTAAAATLAGLRLEQTVIQQILRSQFMRESTMVQAWLQEGREEGREKLRKAAQNFLAMGVSLEQAAQVLEMSVAEVRELLQ